MCHSLPSSLSQTAIWSSPGKKKRNHLLNSCHCLCVKVRMEWTCSWEGLFCLFQPLKGSQSVLAAKCVVNMMNCCPLQNSRTIKSPYGENSGRQQKYKSHRNYYLCKSFYITSMWSAAGVELGKIKRKYLVNLRGLLWWLLHVNHLELDLNPNNVL